MKKLMMCTLIGLFCFSTMTSFAQTKKETPQEKILRLEVENKVLREQVQNLMQQVIELKAQQKTMLRNPGTQTSANHRKASVPLKPYYANLDIQRICESSSLCKSFAEREYATYQFQITKAVITGTKTLKGWLDSCKATYISISYREGTYNYTKKILIRRWADGTVKEDWH